MDYIYQFSGADGYNILNREAAHKYTIKAYYN